MPRSLIALLLLLVTLPVAAQSDAEAKTSEAAQKLKTEAVELLPDRSIALSAQTAGQVQHQAPTNALAPGLQRARPFMEGRCGTMPIRIT